MARPRSSEFIAFLVMLPDIVAADIGTHRGIDEQDKIGDGAKHQMAEGIEFMKDEGKEIEMEDREEQYQGKTFMKATFYADFEKVQSSIQGKEFRRDILAFALNNIELLNLGDGV